jgi:HK97 family phage prohead protease
MERKIAALECQWKEADRTDRETGSLTGYASTFGNVDLGGDVVMPGAFAGAVRDLRASGGIPLLADHMALTENVLGTIREASEDAKGLKVRAVFAATQRAQDVRTLMLGEHLSKLSIGYEALRWRYEDRDGNQIRLLDEVRLWEASVVVFPMNPLATAGAKAAGHGLGSPGLADLDLRLAEVEVALATLLRC